MILGVVLGGAAVLGVVSGALYLTRRMRPAETPPAAAGAATVRVNLRSTIAGAEILVDGQRCGVDACGMDLRPIAHQAEAHKAGHEDAVVGFEATANTPAVELSPRPLPATVVFRTDLDSGSVRLNGRAAGSLVSGSLELPDLPAGVHRVELSSGAFRASLELDAQPGAPPRLAKPPAANGLRVTVIAAAGGEARVHTTVKHAEVAMGAVELGLAGDAGVPLPALDRGSHQISIKQPKGTPFDVIYETANAPSALVLINSNKGLGSLRVSTGDDEAAIFLDGAVQNRKPRNGRALLLVPPRTYRVRVERRGFVTPAEKEVRVAAGSEASVEFQLQPAPTRASLRITGAPAGAAVTLDGTASGTAGPDGALLIGGETPGRRVLEVRRDGYLPGRFEVTLEAGRSAQIRAALARAPGTLRWEAPAGASIRIRKQGQFEDRAVEGTRITLAEGEYTVTASPAGGGAAAPSVSQRVKVAAGGETAVALRFPATAAAPALAAAQPRTEDLLEAWVSTAGWQRAGNQVAKLGGGITLAPVSSTASAIEFTAHLRKGRRLRWVTGYRDAGNYTLYEFGDSTLERTAVSGGARTPGNTATHGASRKGPIRIRVDGHSAAGAVVTSAFIDGQWVNLDSAPSPPGLRRFGFHIPGSDEVGLSEFHATSFR